MTLGAGALGSRLGQGLGREDGAGLRQEPWEGRGVWMREILK